MKENVFSILHISDLHKRQNDDYENLLQSLKDDCNTYVSSLSITKPEIVVVTGDIIKGGNQVEIEHQYTDANYFLNKIVDFFLNGDKNRIILVPGNHDVDWNVSIASMIRDSTSNNNKNREKLKYVDSEIRWSWEDLCFYKIKDENIYNKRMDNFIDFYNNFYKGIKEYPKDPKEQYHIFDIPELNVSFVAYNSCYRNDHLNLTGCINPNCISKSSADLDNLHRNGRLLIGVWHHNISGLPYENNYMDQRALRIMIDKNIQIGLFGHQHSCHVINELKNVIENKRILLVSAGTLYGIKEILPYGTKRQYNLIALNIQNNKLIFRIFLREDKSPELFEIPAWGEGGLENCLDSSWTTEITIPQKPDIGVKLDAIMKEREVTQDDEKMINQLITLNTKHLLVRKILLDILDKNNKHDLIYQYFIDPINTHEAVYLMNAVLELGDISRIENIMAIPLIINSNDASVKEQLNRLKLYIKEKTHGTN